MDKPVLTVAIPVSHALVTALNMGLDEIAAAMRQEYALALYQSGKITLSQGAELCGVDLYGFMALLSRASIPATDYSGEELEEDYARLRAALG